MRISIPGVLAENARTLATIFGAADAANKPPLHGGVVETDAGPANPQQFSPGIGEWTREADGQYTITYTQLQFDENQNLIGTFRAKMVATFDESKKIVVGSVRVRFYDTSDAIVLEEEGFVQGSRVPLD